MTWQNIASSEVDANSPLSTTLMQKIKGNLDALHPFAQVKPTLFNNSDADDDSVSKELNEYYQAVDQATIVVPPGITRLKVAVHMKANGTGTRMAKAVAGTTDSDEHTFTTTEYEEFTLTITGLSPGVMSLQIQAKTTGTTTAYMGWFCAWVEYD